MTFREFMDVYRGYRTPHLKIIEHRRRWFLFSGFLIAISLVGLLVMRLNLSIDFEGGAQISYPLETAVTAEDVQATLDDFGLTGEVQIVSGDQVAIRTESLSDLEDTQALARALATQAGVTVQDVNVEDVGPTWGAEISNKALRGLVLVLAAIALYIALRFEWHMAVGAMIALVHDVVITAGVYALTAREVTPETVIAILTILGFSLYDTVVIYDKIKENTESAALVARLGYVGVLNHSLNQVLMRSVNTSLVVLLPILSLLVFGGDTLKDFAFAMFVGTAIGAYSSIFIAAPVLTLFHREPERARRVPGVARQPSARTAAVATGDAAAAATTARQGRPSGTRPRPSGKRRPPAKRKRR
ncbi:MAG TPA: protein translocase subunit SecF [Actinomycetota bacterium]|jgi:preprotein translocase subunit SecF